MENRNLKQDLAQLDVILKDQGISRRDAMKMMGLGGATFLMSGTETKAATSLEASNAKGKIVIIGGGLGCVAIYVMALTSNDNAVKKLGFKRWKQIHWFGANYIAVIFALTYVGKLLVGQPNGSDYDYLTFALMVGIIFMVFIL